MVSSNCYRPRSSDRIHRPAQAAPVSKPDGRQLLLYRREPVAAGLVAPSPAGTGSTTPNAHLRWHPLRGEWVAYASHRQHRTFLPPPQYNPVAASKDGAFQLRSRPAECANRPGFYSGRGDALDQAQSSAVSGSAACSSSIIVTPRSPRLEFSHAMGRVARVRRRDDTGAFSDVAAERTRLAVNLGALPVRRSSQWSSHGRGRGVSGATGGRPLAARG